MDKITIAIDGFSGCGKSSTAKAVARILGYTYIDTGAMYRAVTLYFIENGIDHSDLDSVMSALANIDISFKLADGRNLTVLNDIVVEDQIRGMDVSNKVSQVSTISEVRRALVAQQKELGSRKGVVMDGRDIGTVVLPDADLKIFMTADLKIRAERRRLELEKKGIQTPLEEIQENLANRDRIDTSRADSPLRKADDAIELDTSHLTFEEQVQKVVDAAQAKIREKG